MPYSDLYIAISKRDTDNAVSLINEHKGSLSGCGYLQIACETNNLKIVKLLLESSEVDNEINNTTCGSNNTPLITSCAIGNVEIVKLLLEKGAEVNVKNINGMTALHYGCRSNNLEIVKFLLEKDAKVLVTDVQNNLPLHFACDRFFIKHANISDNQCRIPSKQDSTEIVKLLLDGGHTQGMIRNSNDRTPLHIACYNNKNLEIIKLLLQYTTRVDIPDKFRATPLDYACITDHVEAVKLLLNYQKAINIFGLLHIACCHDSYRVVKFFLEDLGIDANCISDNENKMTPLHIACHSRSIFTIEVLLQHGASLVVVNKLQSTPLHCACDHGNLNVVKLLLQHDNSNINAADESGETSMYRACANGYLGIVKLLLEYGAKIDIEMPLQNKSALKITLHNEHFDIVTLLIQYGANINDPYFDDKEIIATIRDYRNGTVNVDNEHYWNAMLHKMATDGEYQQSLLGQNEKYDNAAEARKLQKLYGNNNNIYYHIRSLEKNTILKYINNPFIASEVRNKLLLNEYIWHRWSQDVGYQLKEEFEQINKSDQLLDNNIRIIKLGRAIFMIESFQAYMNVLDIKISIAQHDFNPAMKKFNYIHLNSDNEYSLHVYNMIMHYILYDEDSYDNKIKNFKKFYNHDKAEELKKYPALQGMQKHPLFPIIDYTLNLAAHKGTDGIENVQYILDNLDDKDGTIFNVLKNIAKVDENNENLSINKTEPNNLKDVCNEFKDFKDNKTYVFYLGLKESLEESKDKTTVILQKWHDGQLPPENAYDDILNTKIFDSGDNHDSDILQFGINDTVSEQRENASLILGKLWTEWHL